MVHLHHPLLILNTQYYWFSLSKHPAHLEQNLTFSIKHVYNRKKIIAGDRFLRCAKLNFPNQKKVVAPGKYINSMPEFDTLSNILILRKI